MRRTYVALIALAIVFFYRMVQNSYATHSGDIPLVTCHFLGIHTGLKARVFTEKIQVALAWDHDIPWYSLCQVPVLEFSFPTRCCGYQE